MYFEIVGHIRDPEVIATDTRLRVRRRLRSAFGVGKREFKIKCLLPTTTTQ
jgi:hypothetical protein